MIEVKTFPDTRPYLPSYARLLLTAKILERLETNGLNWRADPMYQYVHGLHDLHPDDTFAASVFDACWHAAREKYDFKHPKCWSNELQQAYRDI